MDLPIGINKDPIHYQRFLELTGLKEIIRQRIRILGGTRIVALLIGKGTARQACKTEDDVESSHQMLLLWHNVTVQGTRHLVEALCNRLFGVLSFLIHLLHGRLDEAPECLVLLSLVYV